MNLVKSIVFCSLGVFSCFSFAANVEVTLKDDLDGDLNGYCLDIVGGGQNIDPANGLQAHTCYSYRGDPEADQAMDPDDIAKGQFRIAAYDVCTTLLSFEAGTKVDLRSCDGSETQAFNFTENGYISPKAAENMCLTVGLETTFGRNGTSPHQIKSLTLELCDSSKTAYQEWRTREQDD